MSIDICVMPKVGDRVMHIMSSSWAQSRQDDQPEPCIVTYVNKDKNYYQVTFVNSGIKECYKVPEVNELKNFKKDYQRTFGKNAKGVYVYESGAIYPSISECAKAIGVLPCTISKHIHGGSSHVKGYHIYIL